jgi:hypothetical protein
MHRRTSIVVVIASSFLLLAVLQGQEVRQSVSGRVIGIPADLPLMARDLRVALVSEPGGESRETAVSQVGGFDFGAVSPGRYVLKVKPSTFFENLSSSESSAPVTVTNQNVSVEIPLFRGVEVRGLARFSNTSQPLLRAYAALVIEPSSPQAGNRRIQADLFTNGIFRFWAEPGEYTVSATGAEIDGLMAGGVRLPSSTLKVTEAAGGTGAFLSMEVFLRSSALEQMYPRPRGEGSTSAEIEAVAAQIRATKSARVTYTLSTGGWTNIGCRLTVNLGPIDSQQASSPALVECADPGDAATFDGPPRMGTGSTVLSKYVALEPAEARQLWEILNDPAFWMGQSNGRDNRGGDGSIGRVEFQAGGKKAYMVTSYNPTFEGRTATGIRPGFQRLLGGIVIRVAHGTIRI